MIPALFISHGAPTLATRSAATGRALAELGHSLPRPNCILVISAHWDTPTPLASLATRPSTIHDFGGFPKALYELGYPCPGAPELAHRTQILLDDAGIACGIHSSRGLDHGAWVPLMLMYPNADIPVTQLSLQSRLGTAHHHRVGKVIAPLCSEGVLVIGSGGIVHNLRDLNWADQDEDKPEPWASHFAEWFALKATANDDDALLDYRRLAPDAVRCHPTEEHLLPFFVALGAGGKARKRITPGFTYGSLGMDAYLFG